MNIVWLGQHSWDDNWSARQQLISRLARRGHRVLYVNPEPDGPPSRLASALRSWRNRCTVQEVLDGLHVLTRRPISGQGWLHRRTLGAAAERLGFWAPVVVCQAASQRWLIRAVNPAAIIYFATDAAGNAAEEESLLRDCDVALAGSNTLLERLRKFQPSSFLQQDGVDLEPERALADSDELYSQRQRLSEAASWQRRADEFEERLSLASSLAAERRRNRGRPDPRPDRHGRQVVLVSPRLDGKDASVRLLHDNYVHNGLSAQQQALYFLSRVLGLSYYGLRRAGRLLRGDISAVRRILVVRNGHLGDTVVFLPTLAALRARYPKARITVALAPGSGAQPLLEASPYVDEVLPLDFFNRSRRDRFIGAAWLLARGFDLAVGGVWYFHLPEAVFSGAPLRLGLYDGHPLQRYADRVVMLDPNLHEAENNLRLVELVTGPIPREQRVPRLKLDESSLLAGAREVSRKLGIPAEAPVVAMHPGSKRPSRRWPATRFAELADALLAQRPELHVVCTGAGTEERELIATIRQRVRPGLRERFHDAVGIADLVGVIGFYDRCRLLVCNDTGVMHVARARGVPLVAIIGPENDRRWGPHPLGPAPAVAVRQQVPGTPHGKWSCPWNLSLASIEANRIKGHVDALLDGTFERTSGITPTGDGPSRLYPLMSDVRRLSFSQLLELGLRLPRVAAIFAHDPALLGEEGARVDAADLAAAGREMRWQVYPMIQTLLITDKPEDFQGLDTGQARVIGVAPEDPDGAWAAVLAASDASLIWPGSAGKHPPTAISSRVGVYLRGPQANVMDGERAWPVRTLISQPLLSGRWLLTRDTLEEMLLHPVRIAEAPAPDDWHAPLTPAAA